MLSNILQQMKSPVLKYEHCYCLAQQCGINTHVELKDALQFLHENVGVVRYFHDIVNFQGFVIKDPQYVFDMITDLIVTTFTFHRTDPAVHEQFTKKGIFSLNVLMKMARSTEVLPPSKLVTLLQHLNIIAELKMDDGFTQYFMPCVLAHSKGSQSAITSTAPSPIPPLLVTFESGYCPKGLFGALVVYLLQNKMKSKLEWRLEQDEIFRDQICLSVGPYDTFQLKVFPAFLFIKHCVSSGASMRKISLPTVCSEVRQCINCAIGKVCEALHFYQKGAYSFGFFCPEAVGTDQFSHPAIVKFLGVDSVEPCNLTCLVTHKRFDLPGGYEYWFNEVRVFQWVMYAITSLQIANVLPVLYNSYSVSFVDDNLLFSG